MYACCIAYLSHVFARKEDSNIIKTVWITDGAWISGLVGAFSTLVFAYLFYRYDVLIQGVSVFSFQLTESKADSIIFVLFSVSLLMIGIEVLRVWRFYGSDYLNIHPDINAKYYIRFIKECVVIYLRQLVFFSLIIAFFHTAGEYGYDRQAPYYQIWFRLLDIIWLALLWGGLPYMLLTRAFKHGEAADRKDISRLLGYALERCMSRINPGYPVSHEAKDIGNVCRGFMVKLFFAPLMTVFFFDQFENLVNNINYINSGLQASTHSGHYTHALFNKDLVNISMSVIFSIDVAIAWCGYIASSRWVDNHIISAEPSLLGWLVCIMSYPPFRLISAWFLIGPGEQAFLAISNQSLVTVFTLMMIVSYGVYMASTLCFGVRFSNLTHRGIIRRGPFAIVRHPAYAAKNFGWWCVGFPVIIYNAPYFGWGHSLSLLAALCFNTWIYYLRAITEERHLIIDNHYQEYCRDVPYRFIPRIL